MTIPLRPKGRGVRKVTNICCQIQPVLYLIRFKGLICVSRNDNISWTLELKCTFSMHQLNAPIPLYPHVTANRLCPDHAVLKLRTSTIVWHCNFHDDAHIAVLSCLPWIFHWEQLNFGICIGYTSIIFPDPERRFSRPGHQIPNHFQALKGKTKFPTISRIPDPLRTLGLK